MTFSKLIISFYQDKLLMLAKNEFVKKQYKVAVLCQDDNTNTTTVFSRN